LIAWHVRRHGAEQAAQAHPEAVFSGAGKIFARTQPALLHVDRALIA
jgi:hypothetical protein